MATVARRRTSSALSRKMLPERVNKAKRKARPDRRSEVERHPGNLVLPFRKVMRHDPTSGRVSEALKRRQSLAAIYKPVLPSVQVHWYVDGYKKGEIAYDPCDADDDGQVQ